jgi:hypothetical protein
MVHETNVEVGGLRTALEINMVNDGMIMAFAIRTREGEGTGCGKHDQ